MTNTLLLPVLPLRDIVVFPHMVVPLFVGRAASMSALEAAMEQGKQILLVTQKNPDSETPRTEELYTHGCQANILQLLKLPDGNVRVLVEGQRRVQLSNVRMESDYLVAESHVLVEQVLDNEKFKALQQTAIEQFSLYGKLSAKITDEVVATSHKMTDGRKLADLIAVHLDVEVSEKQKILSLADPVVRLTLILEFMQAQLERMKIDKKIRTRVKSQMEKTHREYYLNEQIKAIQTELGHGEVPDEMTEMAERIKACKFTPEARQKAETELTRLRKMSPMAAEAGVGRNYLDVLLEIGE
ncbi:LON peptidase substrate-binding domain-containing protein [Nitrosopumilus sp. Nsub]|uniref:LON peptidase substrate-binding domain-containing protein n=1 Tax=Nitrosopumilus sp. Nsub TaxID=1776294 RepID=UPI0008308658|nr:LON peptidase substrate-binding domain-containing protein [Nitrosopumilus sp. Nsub]